MTERLVCLIQARMNSSRLPGKVLKPLGGQPVLGHVINRCRGIGGVDAVVIAGVEGPAEDPVADLGAELGVDVERGPEQDVLTRFHRAAEAHRADHVMRVTADCPVLDPALCTQLVTAYYARRPDYAALAGWPHGMSCEVFSRSLLDTMHANADDADDREHVTLWANRQKHRPRLHLMPEDDRDLDRSYRLTLDYPEDYAVLDRLAQLMGPTFTTATVRDLIAMMDNYPELKELNAAAGEAWRNAARPLYSKPPPKEGDGEDRLITLRTQW